MIGRKFFHALPLGFAISACLWVAIALFTLI
jgi:hypothetical protein